MNLYFVGLVKGNAAYTLKATRINDMNTRTYLVRI